MSRPLPWLAHYDEGVPHTLAPYPDRTILDYIADAARTNPDSPALTFKGTRVSYGQLDRESSAFAAALQALGVTKGDRVALLLPNCPQFFVAEIAAWKIGAVVAPLNPIYTDRELEAPLREHGVHTIVTLTRFYDRVRRLQSSTGVTHIVATNIKDYFPPLLRLLFTLLREKKDGDRVTIAPEHHQYNALLRQHRDQKATAEPISPDDPAVLLMSGGTTGSAKGVLGTHRAYVHTGLQLAAWTKSVVGRGDTRTMLPLPMFHVYANVGVQAHCFVTANALVLVPNPRDLPDLLKTIQREKPNVINGVPTLYVAMLNHPDVKAGKIDFSPVKLCFCGAAALLADTRSRFEQLTGGHIIEGYSLTEAMMALCVNPVMGTNKIGSAGLPLPDVRVGIVDADEGTAEMPAGEVGEICFAGAQLMTGFWNRPDETASVLRDRKGPDGSTTRWLHTGDLGYLDADGYLFIVDRKKDLIKTSGFQVWPREVEEVLATHPAVQEVGVAGVPDERRGEAVKAWVVLRAGQTATEAELRAFCRESLAPYKVPVAIAFRPDLPKTLIGKVLRRALREDIGA
ncbi:MAG: long-chain fatty acid--CoA ligase [Acidobacteriaceae bacterium]|jgi:long-chain acyl-CoA synthetase|nr:long-chain fatty acid--CoA ligase [Acidobacteriaceae bacterium]